MVEVDNRIVDDVSIHDESYVATDLIRMLERQLAESRPGVPRDVVEAYANALGYDRARLDGEIDERLVDGDTWRPGGRIYRVGDNLSAYPASWHAAVADPSDLRGLIRVMADQVTHAEGIEMTVTWEGVSQRSLLLAVEAMTGLDRTEGRRILHGHRDRREIHLSAFQNPEATIRLVE